MNAPWKICRATSYGPVWRYASLRVSQERITYIPGQYGLSNSSQVLYRSKDGRSTKTFPALDWLAQLVTHISNRYEHMVRYYGYYSNKSRGLRRKADADDSVPAMVELDISSKSLRQNWALLIQKIYEVDPLLCTKCRGPMRIIAFIEDEDPIEKILRHLNLWDTCHVGRDPPTSDEVYTPTSEAEHVFDDSFSQLQKVDY